MTDLVVFKDILELEWFCCLCDVLFVYVSVLRCPVTFYFYFHNLPDMG